MTLHFEYFSIAAGITYEESCINFLIFINTQTFYNT